MKIAFIDVYNPIPINSGGDWYRYQLLTSLGLISEVTEYYTLDIQNKKGYSPNIVNFKTEFLSSKIPWFKLSNILEIFKPDYLFNKSKTKSINCDIVFFSTVCYHIARGIVTNNRSPIVLVMHNVEWQYLKNNNSLLWIPMKFYEHFIIKNVDSIVTISPKDFNYVMRLAPKCKVFYIPPKINVEIFSPQGPVYDFGKDKFNILFYGSLDREQNVDALKFILNELLPYMHENNSFKYFRMNIFGSGTPPESICLDRPDINFLGVVELPGEYVRGADVVIVPLKNSGGIKIRLLEALACKKFVVASPESVEGLPDEIKSMIFVARNAEEYVKIISQIYNKILNNNVNLDLINKYLSGDSMEDVIDYISQK